MYCDPSESDDSKGAEDGENDVQLAPAIGKERWDHAEGHASAVYDNSERDACGKWKAYHFGAKRGELG